MDCREISADILGIANKSRSQVMSALHTDLHISWTNCGLPREVTQEMVDALTATTCRFSLSSSGWMVLNALQKSKTVILTEPPGPSSATGLVAAGK